ncbi:MAG: glycine cleavage system aminomethyltransferase GcvT [Pseudomonadota bacterium]
MGETTDANTSSGTGSAVLAETPLTARHRAHGARMVPFAGYNMPVQYPAGILAEHQWTRTHAGMFDVSHMGQARLVAGDGRHETVAAALEMLCAADVVRLANGRQRYTQLLTDDGGIIDDLMVARPDDPENDGTLVLVVNAARKERDYAHMRDRLPAGVTLAPIPERALIALQGPEACAVLADHVPGVDGMRFMDTRTGSFDGVDLHLSRSGYTGEDGFELSVPADQTDQIWTTLLANDCVKPVGLGARDTLRLEAGLCLYGNDIDETTSPVEAGLSWSISKRRRAERGFPGEARILAELADGPSRKLVGLTLEGRAPAREGAEITTPDGQAVGRVTSGGFAPSVGGPIALGYVAAEHASADTKLALVVRGKALPAVVTTLPFVPNRYLR